MKNKKMFFIRQIVLKVRYEKKIFSNPAMKRLTNVKKVNFCQLFWSFFKMWKLFSESSFCFTSFFQLSQQERMLRNNLIISILQILVLSPTELVCCVDETYSRPSNTKTLWPGHAHGKSVCWISMSLRAYYNILY